jgi:hypothetical protein
MRSCCEAIPDLLVQFLQSIETPREWIARAQARASLQRPLRHRSVVRFRRSRLLPQDLVSVHQGTLIGERFAVDFFGLVHSYVTPPV